MTEQQIQDRITELTNQGVDADDRQNGNAVDPVAEEKG